MSIWAEKHVFILQKISLFHDQNNANKLKRNVFGKTGIESAKKHWNPASTQCSQ